MAIHDWTRVAAGDFHHFHQAWITFLASSLNSGGLPPGYMAMAEQVTGRPIPDVVTLHAGRRDDQVGPATATAVKSTAWLVQKTVRQNYAKRKDRVIIRHGRGRVVAIIEIVSPSDKDSQIAIRTFVQKAADILHQGVNLLIVDLVPPTPRDPLGIHKTIWDEFVEEPFPFLPEKPLTVASYLGGDLPTAYVETVGVGDELPSMPIFLSDEETDRVPAPLDATYLQAWGTFPDMLKALLQPPVP